jgi:hypothetical protein
MAVGVYDAGPQRDENTINSVSEGDKNRNEQKNHRRNPTFLSFGSFLGWALAQGWI